MNETERRDDDHASRDRDDRRGSQGNPYLGLFAVIAGIALAYWLATTFVDWNKTQECVGYGKRNCGPRIELHGN